MPAGLPMTPVTAPGCQSPRSCPPSRAQGGRGKRRGSTAGAAQIIRAELALERLRRAADERLAEAHRGVG